MICPPHLNQGDTIGIVSTARKISPDELAPALEVIKSWGLKIELGSNLYQSNNQFAGTARQRAADLQAFIDNPKVKAILCARGGYGSVQVLEHVNFFKLIENPTWIVGYSDVTALHNKLAALGFESLHATMPINFATNTEASLESLRKALFGQALTIECSEHSFNRKGRAEGAITGGNLSMVYSQCGSDSALETSGKILFLEDLDEYLYHVDRMMYNLKRNGYLKNLAGLIVGGMTGMNDNAVPFGETAEEIIKRHTEPYNFPVAFGFPAGHLDDNRTLIFGRKAILQVEHKKTTLSFS